jgi:hypothetical protein
LSFCLIKAKWPKICWKECLWFIQNVIFAYPLFSPTIKFNLSWPIAFITLYLHSPSPFSYISFEIDIVFIWNYKMHVHCKTSLIRFFSSKARLIYHVYKYWFFYLLFYTAELPRWRQGLTYLAAPSKLKYDVCRKML